MSIISSAVVRISSRRFVNLTLRESWQSERRPSIDRLRNRRRTGSRLRIRITHRLRVVVNCSSVMEPVVPRSITCTAVNQETISKGAATVFISRGVFAIFVLLILLPADNYVSAQGTLTVTTLAGIAGSSAFI